MARLLRVGAGVWAGASLLAAALTPGAALLNPYGQGFLMLGWLSGATAVAVMGAVDAGRRRISPTGAGIAVVAYALPVVLVFAAVEASRRLAPSAFDPSLASPFLVPLLIVLYLAGAMLARTAGGGPTSNAVGAFLVLPGAAALVVSSALAWNAFHSMEWRNRRVSLGMDQSSWRAGALLVEGTLDLSRADPGDLATVDDIDARYVYHLANRQVWARPERFEWLDGNGHQPDRPGRYRFRALFAELEAGREAPGPHEVQLLLTRPAAAGRESVRELRGPVPRPPFPLVELSHSSVERSGEAVNVRSFLAVSRPGSYRIEAALQPMGGAVDGVREEERPRGPAPDAVEWARGVTEPYLFTPVGPTIALGPEDDGILALRWRIGMTRAVAIVRVREAEAGRRLLKEARIPVG